tara:strand:- start:179 stop:490 length:312 start_codon:yes stop_codon:yes gene_type:complete
MSNLRYVDTIQGIQFHNNADDFASEIVKRAIIFASEVPLPDSAAMRPNSNTLVSKHVEAQLAFFKSEDCSLGHPMVNVVERVANALEVLANAHAENGDARGRN